ncbi:hypothetical protein SDC9_28972 [bioreactor metagenome]|uniref:Uncharacterized protein n=1 Tax=bioreactor metagenome TaxID=1076179 RepID=A0A644UW32_9ZZZZ
MHYIGICSGCRWGSCDGKNTAVIDACNTCRKTRCISSGSTTTNGIGYGCDGNIGTQRLIVSSGSRGQLYSGIRVYSDGACSSCGGGAGPCGSYNIVKSSLNCRCSANGKSVAGQNPGNPSGEASRSHIGHSAGNSIYNVANWSVDTNELS